MTDHQITEAKRQAGLETLRVIMKPGAKPSGWTVLPHGAEIDKTMVDRVKVEYGL